VTSLHHDIAAGSVLTIAIGGQVRIIRVEALPLRRGPATEAQACYVDLSMPQEIDADTL
jgi:ribosome-associated heat shock protein Hsp15